MIKVQIPDEIPQTLLTDGVQKKLEHCDLYDKNKESYNKGKETFIFSTEVYGSTSVKASLETAHHKKCCYCESIFEATSYGEVEHYRPKGVISPKKKGRKIYPGYYW